MADGVIDVAEVARLARLALTPEEEIALQAELEQIVSYVDKIGELNLEGVEPMVRTLEDENVYREDVSRPGIDRDLVLDNAPQVFDDELFKVPVVIEEGGA